MQIRRFANYLCYNVTSAFYVFILGFLCIYWIQIKNRESNNFTGIGID